MLYSFFRVIPRRLNLMCRRFGTLFSVFVGRVNKKNGRNDIVRVFIKIKFRLKGRLSQSEGGVTGRRLFRVEEQAMEGNDPKLFFFFTGPMKMEETECSETSAYKIQTPRNHSRERIHQILSCSYPCTDITISNKYRQMHRYIISVLGRQQYDVTWLLPNTTRCTVN
jgi:hypothetical protein